MKLGVKGLGVINMSKGHLCEIVGLGILARRCKSGTARAGTGQEWSGAWWRAEG